jgi:aminoglycoside phosphotransferase (APT) family kinase protein
MEREARYINFDFDALCNKIISFCPGAHSIISYSKIEGGYNHVFIFRTDNAQRIVARLPFSVAGPARLSTDSEVETVKYLQAKTSIPIPKILDRSNDATNTIGSEYIIMDHAPGI